MVHAQAISLGINPPLITIEANPPATITTPITLENKADETVRLTIKLRPFTSAPSDDGKPRYLPLGTTEKNFFRWIQLRDRNGAVTSITLSPLQKKTLDLHLAIPKDEPVRDHYFSVVFLGENSAKTKDQADNQTTLIGGIATNVLVSIGAKGKTTAVLEEFSAPSFLKSGPVPFVIRLKNTSSHLIEPTGEIYIKNMFGQTIGKVSLLPVKLLSQTSRYIPDGRQSVLENKTNTSPAAIWDDQFLLGLYKAQINLSLSENGPAITREVTFFAFPLILLTGSLVFISIFLFIRSRLKNRIK